MTGITYTFSDIVAVLALLLSVVATMATIFFNHRQKSLIRSQDALNQRLLAREEDDARAARKADLSANLVKLSKSDWRLKVFNRGKAAARNVTLDWPKDDDLLIPGDVESKFPLEVLEPMQGVELLASVHFGSKSKHELTIRWADDFDQHNEKTVYPTI